MAKNGPKWPKFGPNTCKFEIFKLEMSQNYVESHTDCPEANFQKSKIFDMPKMAKNSYFGHKKLRLISLAKIRAKRTSPSFSEAFLLSVCKKSVKKYQNIRCKGLILAILGHFGHVKNFRFLNNCFWAISMTFYIILRHLQFENIKMTCVRAKLGPIWAIFGYFGHVQNFEFF